MGGFRMTARRWLVLILCVFLVAVAVTLYALPELIRRVAVARIHALTERPTAIERVGVNLLTGRFTVYGFKLMEREGDRPFADFQTLHGRIHLPSLLVGHLWLRELILSDSTVRVVRLPSNEFNFGDLIKSSGTTATGRGTDVTVDHFVLQRGTVTLEDQALPQRRTWASDHITIEARNVSTRRGDGTATGSSVTAGAPVTIAVKDWRLAPVHLQATVAVQGLDVTLAQVYLPPDTIQVDRGRATSSVRVTLDARDGIRADATGRFEDVALLRPDGSEVLALVPGLTTRVDGFAFRDGDLSVGTFTADGAVKVRDPMVKQAGRFLHADVRANIANLTWPATTPGQIEVTTTIQGGGRLAVTGSVQAPPAPSQLRIRLSNFDLAPWAQFVPIEARVSGIAEADLHVNEPLAVGIPARMQGLVAVNRLGVADAKREVVGAQRIEASGLELQWPTRLVVSRVLVSGPRGIVARDRVGHFPLTDLLRRRPLVSPASAAASRPTATPALRVDVGETVVRGGAVSWRDETVAPPAQLDLRNIDGRLTGIGWPLLGPAGVRVALRPPGGGHMQLNGRVDLDPVAADVRVVTKGAELAPYQPYLPTTARVAGAADIDLAVVVPSLAARRATARGSAGLARLDVRDSERTVMRIERAQATGIDVTWPERVAVARLELTQPWLLMERDEKGGLPLRTLLAARASAAPTANTSVASRTADAASTPSAASSAGSPGSDSTQENGGTPLAITVAQLDVERGGLRIVDRAVSPAFAVDLQPATVKAQGLSTAPSKPARLDVVGQLGPGSELALRGTLGSLGGPLKLDVNGELRGFAVPRANPYVLQAAGWKTTAGRLTTTLQCRIDGDALAAQTNIKLSRLQLVRASPQDTAQKRLELPLGMLTSLMKDKRGDINVAFPVSGKLSDPKFDFSEAIWSAVRSVAINAIALPVSWIGRVHMSPDSRIERIDVNPIAFEPGTAEPTATGRAQIAQVVAFLDRLPEAKMALTPVISASDVKALERGRGTPSAVPATDVNEVAPSPLVKQEPAAPSAVRKLAEARLDAVKSAIKQGGVDTRRLEERQAVQQEDVDARVALDVLEPETPRPSKVRETIDRVRGKITGSE
jgi:Domain of Unknown Function (DUF748)